MIQIVNTSDLDRHAGCLLGLAVGDALGTTLEFSRKGDVTPISDIVGGGPFGLDAGQWTDDTSMALCLADSLVACNGFDAADQMRRYVRWWREGVRSSRPGNCFDIGATVRAALRRFERSGDPFAGSTDPQTAGNGSLMRLAPVPMFYRDEPTAAIARAAESSKTTHAATEAVDACRYFAALVVGALSGASKAALTSDLFAPEGIRWREHPLAPAVERIATGSYKDVDASRIRASAYVIHTLEAALWAFYHSSSFEEGALLAVNLGEDADTTGAVFGQLAGAYYGKAGIPARWLEQLYQEKVIEDLATALYRSQGATT